MRDRIKKITESRSKFRTKNTDSEWKIHTFIKTDVGVIKKVSLIE